MFFELPPMLLGLPSVLLALPPMILDLPSITLAVLTMIFLLFTVLLALPSVFFLLPSMILYISGQNMNKKIVLYALPKAAQARGIEAKPPADRRKPVAGDGATAKQPRRA